MHRFILLISMALALCFNLVSFANACIVRAPFEPEDVLYADAVVIGRVANYEVIKDYEAREQREGLIARIPLLRDFLTEDRGYLSDYARFEVRVDKVLLGNVEDVFTVTWDNSTFGEPKSVEDDIYLIAVRDPSKPAPPLRGPSATILPAPEKETLSLLQAPCSGAFLLPIDSWAAQSAWKAIIRSSEEMEERQPGSAQ